MGARNCWIAVLGVRWQGLARIFGSLSFPQRISFHEQYVEQQRGCTGFQDGCLQEWAQATLGDGAARRQCCDLTFLAARRGTVPGGPVRHGGLSKFRWCPFPTTPGAVAQVQPSPGPSSRVASQPWLKVHRCGAMWPAMQDQEKSDAFELWRLVISSAGLATRLGRILAATEDQKAIRETWLHPWQEKLLRRCGAGRVPCWFQSLDECGGDCTYPNFSGHRGAGLQILLPAASGRNSRIPCGQVIVLSPRKLLCPCSKWSSSRRWRWKGWAAHPSSRAWMGLL